MCVSPIWGLYNLYLLNITYAYIYQSNFEANILRVIYLKDIMGWILPFRKDVRLPQQLQRAMAAEAEAAREARAKVSCQGGQKKPVPS